MRECWHYYGRQLRWPDGILNSSTHNLSITLRLFILHSVMFSYSHQSPVIFRHHTDCTKSRSMFYSSQYMSFLLKLLWILIFRQEYRREVKTSYHLFIGNTSQFLVFFMKTCLSKSISLMKKNDAEWIIKISII